MVKRHQEDGHWSIVNFFQLDRGQEDFAPQNEFFARLIRIGQWIAKSGRTLASILRRVIDRADEAVAFFIRLIRQWYGTAERSFFPGYGKTVASAAGCVCCVVFVAAALLLEPFFSPQIIPAELPQTAEEATAEEPFDLEALVAEYEQNARAQAQAAPVTVSVAPEDQISLTMDSLKNYELASAARPLDSGFIPVGRFRTGTGGVLPRLYQQRYHRVAANPWYQH